MLLKIKRFSLICFKKIGKQQRIYLLALLCSEKSIKLFECLLPINSLLEIKSSGRVISFICLLNAYFSSFSYFHKNAAENEN